MMCGPIAALVGAERVRELFRFGYLTCVKYEHSRLPDAFCCWFAIECPGTIDCLERVTASSWWQRVVSCLTPSAARSWPFRLDYVFVDLPRAPVAQDGSIIALCWTVVSGVARVLYDNLIRGLCARLGYGASDSAEAEFDVGGGDANASVDIEGGGPRQASSDFARMTVGTIEVVEAPFAARLPVRSFYLCDLKSGSWSGSFELFVPFVIVCRC